MVRTIGTDDKLSIALLWELWQRGVNRESWGQELKWAQLEDKVKPVAPRHNCKDGLVLISELDSKYARKLSQNFIDGFSSLCDTGPNEAKLIRTFNYMRGLDGVLPDIDKSGTKVLPKNKDEGEKPKDLRAHLEDGPLEHAEGRSQYDYLRRLADEIAMLNSDKQFAENGIKAIGIVGSDVYDKLLILQALRSRFKGKIFFTTDLDARYLHADQKGWARNLVVASNFGLTLRPELQHSTLPFRDSYQTAIYLATLIALDNDKPMEHWTTMMKYWLYPRIFEIGRTKAVHLASPTVGDLTLWHNSYDTQGIFFPKKYISCNRNDWRECMDIEPYRSPSFEYMHLILLIISGILLMALASLYVHETLRAAKNAFSSNTLLSLMNTKAAKFWFMGVGLLALVLYILAFIIGKMNISVDQGIGEPFVWLEGISVWPSLVLNFIGLALMLVLALAYWIMIRREAHRISRDFNFALPHTWTLVRSRWSAMWNGPYVDLTSFNREGKVDPKLVGPEVEIATLWQNYLRVTGIREMKGWVVLSTVIGISLGYAAFKVFGMPLFPHRGQFVERLNIILILLNTLILWLSIFWVSYQTRACAQFIKLLSNLRSVRPPERRLLERKEATSGVPREYLADYIYFQMVMRATKRVRQLIYLPFFSIFFMVIARSDIFDAMNFPFALVLVIGLVVVYALYSEVLLRRGAVAARDKTLEHYETRLHMQASPTESPMSAEQIKLLMERIRDTHEGVFAPIYEQPALRALLLPFGGFGGAQLIEYLINRMM